MDSQSAEASTSMQTTQATAPNVPASVLAVSSALQANEAHRDALNIRRAILRRELETAAVLLETFDADVDPRLEEVKAKNPDEWDVFAVAGASAVRPLLSSRQINSEVGLH